MQVENLELKNFRNYSSLNIKFKKEINIIYGNNAQGKTNIMEAIYLCATGRSHRTSKDNELLKHGAGVFDIKLLLERDGVNKEIEIKYSTEERKKIRINGIPVKKIGDLLGHLNAVMFSPEDLLLIKQGPVERRRFVDITLSQLRHSYFYELQQYAKILYQRNALLKNIAFKKELESTLDVWDSHIARTGARIMKARINFVAKLDVLSGMRHKNLTNNEEILSLKYSPSIDYREGSEEAEIEKLLTRMLERNRRKEIQKGVTLIGPHRDDIDIILNGVSTKIYGSQGQQRTAVLSMKLAEIDLMKEDSGEYPILLLDDVLSELDDNRKEYLLESIKRTQTFVTCTNIRSFNRNNEETAFFYVEGGNVDHVV